MRAYIPFCSLCRWVKDPKVTGYKRLAECTDLIDAEDIGEPTYFVR